MQSIIDAISEDSFGEQRISFFKNNKLIECWMQNNNAQSKISEIHLAKIIQIVKPIKRVFYELFNGSQVSARYKLEPPKIGDLEIITIVAEQRDGKPAHAQRGFFLKSKYAIILNEDNFLGISKKIINENDREKLINLAIKTNLKNAGAIIRSLADGIPEDELERDFSEIVTIWKRLRERISHTKPTIIFEGHDLQKQAEYNFPNIKIIQDKCSFEFNKRNGLGQLLEAYNSIFNIKNGGTLYFENTKALTAIDIDSSKRDLDKGGLNKLAEDGLSLSLDLIRLRNSSGLIAIDMPRLSKYEFNERYEQIKLWSEDLSRNTRILGGTKGGVFEIICNHERACLDDTENGVSKFIATEALKQLSISKINNSNLYVSEHLNNIINSSFKKELKGIKEIISTAKILIDKSIDDDNFYL